MASRDNNSVILLAEEEVRQVYYFWTCHICGGGPFWVSTTPGCVLCGHFRCTSCSVASETA